ncbi:MAG: hypothetical protein L0I48_08970 [Lactococcus plantarum]|nr:hypothetical protein [Lactococcus plantarum]
MDSHNTLFNASFEESKNIQAEYGKYIKNSYKQMGLLDTLFTALLAIVFFGTITYGLGVGMLEGFLTAKQNEINILNYHNVKLAAKFAYPFIVISKCVVYLWVGVWSIIIIRRLMPNWTVVSFVTLGGLAGAVMPLLLFCSLGPILYGFALVGVGRLGIYFQVILLIFWGINQFNIELNRIYQSLYYNKKSSDKNIKKNVVINKLILIIIIFVFIIVNMCTFRVGFISNSFELFSLLYSWLFLLLGLFTIFIIKILVIRNGISSYYFWKYKENYKKNWNLTDEQWYGKRKAKKLAKKKLKLEKRGK